MEAINFIKENWTVIVPVLIAIISEVMALHPKSKANGILQLAKNILSKDAK